MKNKKFLILLCIPLIISVMVLPLCSFTTLEGNINSPSVFTPALHSSVGYIYHRSTSTLDLRYYGEIPDFNRTLIDRIEETDYTILDVNSIQTYASDYIITGNVSINYSSRSSSSYPSIYNLTSSLDYMTADVSLYSEKPSVAYFSGDFSFSGLILPEDPDKNGLEHTAVRLISSSDNLPFTPSDFRCEVYVKYAMEYQDQVIYNDSYTRCELSDVSNVLDGEYISFNSILKHCFSHEGFYSDPDWIDPISTPVYQYISDVKFNFISNVGEYISGVALRDMLYNVDALDFRVYTLSDFIADYYYDLGSEDGYTNGYDIGLENGYNSGYGAGYDSGLSNSASVWGSFSDFLKNTIGAFLDMHITPNITISGILSVIISIGLVILFLRLFAGG